MKKRLLSVMLVLSMLMTMVPTAFAAEGSAEEINYVSIGDSMANGYCFEGYAQGENDVGYDDYNFFTGEKMYGQGAYPLQFEEYLTEQGYDVTHTKLAPSAMLAEDLLYLLGGIDEEINDGWSGYRSYIGGADVVITKFGIDNIFMSDYEKTTRTYTDLLDALKYKGYKWTTPKVGSTYTLGSAQITIVGPGYSYDEPNNSSIVSILPRLHATSIACRMARSTRLGVVL